MVSVSLFLFLLLVALGTSSLPLQADAQSNNKEKTYIVQVQNDLKPSVFPDVNVWYSSTLRALFASSPATAKDPHQARRAPLHVYRSVFHGFSAVLTPAEADTLRSQRGVLAVIPDHRRHLHTTRSPQFLGLLSPNSRPNSLLAEADSGSKAVIALLDSGISPGHRSFSDVGLPPPPPTWKGECQSGPSFPSTSCNKKLVGARFFASGFLAAAASSTAKNNSSDVMSPIDTEGHGTHTASTAAGVPAKNASLLGIFAAGIASGVAPKSRVASYKVCWSSGCFDSDILGAIDRAVEDGADVISLSVGAGPTPYHLDPIAIGAFGAVERGVLFSASAGNDGPGDVTVTNIAPWITTVGASTIDRGFPADVVLGDGTVFTGVSLYTGNRRDSPGHAFPLVYGGNASTSRLGFRSSAPFCMRGSLEPSLVRGKVVLCERGGISRVEKGLAVKEAGGAGMIVANQFLENEGVVPDAHLLPAVAVGYSAGNRIHGYLITAADPRVRFVFHGTQVGVKPAPVVASFSGRGPSAQSAYVIKPDVIAPGVGILAAWPSGVCPTGLLEDTRHTEFNIMSGTSMACPHVSGVAALLKAAHPDWSPAAIRSAMMTTAYVIDSLGQEMIDENTGNRTTPWAYGCGHVDPEKAVNPGLVYELTTEDYINFLCSSNYSDTQIQTISRTTVNCSQRAESKPWDLNYPSISVALQQPGESKLEVSVHRTLTSVGDSSSTYSVAVREPEGVKVVVEPQKLVFADKGVKQEFAVRMSAESIKLPPGDSLTEFGLVTWSDGRRTVRSPIAVTWQQAF